MARHNVFTGKTHTIGELAMTDTQRLVEEYLANARAHAATTYADSKSVRTSNRAADRMRAIALQFSSRSLDDKRTFALLLDDTTETVAAWAAHHVLEMMAPDDKTTQRALLVIERQSSGTGPNALGERIWLENWRAQNTGRPPLR
jgi:hypothetical protein